MIKPEFLKEITEKLTALLPKQLHTVREDFAKQCRSVLQHVFTQYDVVTREEFDIQVKVLARTRQRIEELEKHVQALEALLHSQNSPQ